MPTIAFVDGIRIVIYYNDMNRPNLQAMLAIGGVFDPLREPARWATVEITDRGRALVWHLHVNDAGRAGRGEARRAAARGGSSSARRGQRPAAPWAAGS
jgi:hypothetical protein